MHQTGCLQLPRIIRSRRESTHKLYYGLVAEPKAIHAVSLRCVPNEKQFPPPPRTSNSPSEMWQVWLCRRRGRPPTVGCRKDMVRQSTVEAHSCQHRQDHICIIPASWLHAVALLTFGNTNQKDAASLMYPQSKKTAG